MANRLLQGFSWNCKILRGVAPPRLGLPLHCGSLAGHILRALREDFVLHHEPENVPGFRGRRQDLLLAGLLVLLALLLLLGLQLLEPHFFLRDDNATHFLPAYEYVYETVVGAHEVPLLNQHQMFGGTFLASGQTGFFLASLYPLRAALDLLGLDPIWLIDLIATWHLLLAGLGMFLLLRFLGIRPALAFPVALCWGFLPFGIITSRAWIFVSYLLAYLPFNQWLLLRCLEAPSARRCLALLLLKTVYFFTGYLHYAIFVSFYEGFFLLFYGWRRPLQWRRQALALGAVYLLLGLLTAPLLLPTWKAKELSWRRAESLPAEIALASPIRPLATLAANFFEVRTTIYFDLSSAATFLGPLWLVGLVALVGYRRRPAPGGGEPWLLAALGVGIFALSMSTSLYWLLFQLPIFNVLRWPFKGFPIAAFFLLLPATARLASWSSGDRSRSFLAAALAWVNLLLQLVLLLPAPWRAPIGPWRLDRSVAELRAAPLVRAIGDQGRVALLAANDDPPERGDALALGYLYATLTGKYHVHGYDPLKARLNVEMGYDIPNYGEIRLAPAAWPAFAPGLTARYLLLRVHSRLLPAVEATPGIRRLLVSEGLVLLENSAALPLVSQLASGRPLPFRWRTNGLELDLPADFPGGQLLVNLAPLAGYSWFRDGQNMGPPEIAYKRPLLLVPPGAAHLELRYSDRSFTVGLLFCAGGLLLVLLLLRRGDTWLVARGPGETT